MARRYLLVANPLAHSGRAAEEIEHLLDRMAERGMEAELLPSEPRGRTVASVRAALEEGRGEVVVAMGGDGTFSEAARGSLAAKRVRPVGLIPSGTANDQARSFGLRPGADQLEHHLDVIEAGQVVQMDVGRIERVGGRRRSDGEALFFDSAGFGFQAEVLAQRNRDREAVEHVPLLRELYRDQAVYAGAALQRYLASFVEQTKFDAEVTAGKEPHRYESLTDLIVKGTAVYAGAWVLDRNSEPDDGRFEVVAIRGRRELFARALGDLEALGDLGEQLEQLGLPRPEIPSASSFEIRLEAHGKPVTAQVDGEEWPAGTHFRVEVLKNRLPFLAPAGFVPPWKGR
ncbi:MAG: hypothetical protein HYZ28_26820 [Myxococcales bacterium]|nr:hypothetical protein [Myxococcales bacterium]